MYNDNLKLSLQYFIYFSTLGVFLPYFNLYCHELGFSSFKIGMLSSTKTVTAIIFPMLWGYLADRFQARKKIFFSTIFCSALAWLFFFFTQNFTLMLVIIFFHGLFYSPIISFMETFTVELLGRKKKKYGQIRLWGSIGFICSVFLTGWLLDLFHTNIILILILVGLLLQFFIALKLQDNQARSAGNNQFSIKSFLNRKTAVFLFVSFLMLGSHSPYYSFYSIYLSDKGLDNIYIGFSWGIAVFAEIIIMHNSNRIFKKVAPLSVLIFSMFAASFRWMILYFTSDIIVILASQVLHCFSYASFHMASILYIDELSPEGQKTTGQAINNAIGYGAGLLAGNIISGAAYDVFGGQNLFLGASFVAMSGGFILMSFSLLEPGIKK